MRCFFALLLLLSGVGCASIRGTERSTVSSSQDIQSAYWFRGTPLSLQAVTQGDIVVHSPLANGSTITFTTWFSGQLTNRTGDAIFPDGHGGEVTEIDISITYSQRFGNVDFTTGGIGYAYPEVRDSTKEAFVSGTIEALGLAHSLTAYYDTDLLDDYYVLYQASKGWKIDEHWSSALGFRLGYMSDDQAAFYFDKENSGLSDMTLSGSLSYNFDANTSIFLKAAGVTVPDDDLSDTLDTNGFENSGEWLTLGVAWGL